jgi:branched-chain amino acid transport system substrate-binding protein
MTTVRRGHRPWLAVAAVLGLLAAGCGGDDSSSSNTTAAAATTAAATTAAPTTAAGTTAAATSAAAEPSTTAAEPADPASAFPSLGPPDGEPMLVGLVNTEGTPGLDFPEIRRTIESATDYLNQHGGMGNRPIELETCTVDGSPEKSQSCAQELAGKGVELVLLGLDLFPDYATYTAENLPVVGVLPILPPDYQANALFLTGGNATVGGAMAAVAKEHFGATKVGIVSADNPGANASEAALTASLDKAGIAHTTVKGGDNETDAGYQGLMREASKDDPDLLVSLYSGPGCIGTMRGRASLGITTPVLTTGICAGRDVIEAVGDDASGWFFTGVSTQEDTPELAILQEIVAPVLEVPPAEVDPTSLSLGGLALFQIMSLATYAGTMQAAGEEVTGRTLYDYLATATGLRLWPDGAEIQCGASASYPAICSFTFPVAEYKDGNVTTVPGLEAVSSLDYLP